MLGGTFGAGSGSCCQPWLVKLKPDGSVDWHMTYEAPGLGGANNIQPTSDGGYVIAGEGIDLFVVKVDADGQLSTTCGLAHDHDTEGGERRKGSAGEENLR